jgi:mRNA interferase RelE/StbE
VVNSYEIRLTKEAKKDVDKLTPKQKVKLHKILINVLSKDPQQGKKLVGDLSGLYSYRLNIKDRIIYSIDEVHRIIFIYRAKTHYGE